MFEHFEMAIDEIPLYHPTIRYAIRRILFRSFRTTRIYMRHSALKLLFTNSNLTLTQRILIHCKLYMRVCVRKETKKENSIRNSAGRGEEVTRIVRKNAPFVSCVIHAV